MRGTKKLTRTFRTEVILPPPLKKWTWEVINGIENDEVRVFDPEDLHALDEVEDPDSKLRVDAELKIPVRVTEWLCVACQSIRLPGEQSDDRSSRTASGNVIAWYRSNAVDVLFPPGGVSTPPGPAALSASVIVQQDWALGLRGDESAEAKFKCVMAHELVHVIDAMKLIVPAFMNWRAYWRMLLQEGSACEAAAIRYGQIASFVDDYGTENEMAMIQCYWPSQGEAWFRALKGQPVPVRLPPR